MLSTSQHITHGQGRLHTFSSDGDVLPLAKKSTDTPPTTSSYIPSLILIPGRISRTDWDYYSKSSPKNIILPRYQKFISSVSLSPHSFISSWKVIINKAPISKNLSRFVSSVGGRRRGGPAGQQQEHSSSCGSAARPTEVHTPEEPRAAT